MLAKSNNPGGNQVQRCWKLQASDGQQPKIDPKKIDPKEDVSFRQFVEIPDAGSARLGQAALMEMLGKRGIRMSGDSKLPGDAALRELIAIRAYELWEEHGRPYGCDFLHWRQAEAEIMSSLGETARKSDRAQLEPAGASPKPAATEISRS